MTRTTRQATTDRATTDHTGDERGGSPGVEALLLVPALVLLICVVVAAGRISAADIAVDSAADAAARAASLERGPVHARQVAVEIATARLVEQCLNPRVEVSVPMVSVGRPSTVTTSVSCDVSWTGLLLPLPGSRTFTAAGSSPVDTYRAR